MFGITLKGIWGNGNNGSSETHHARRVERPLILQGQKRDLERPDLAESKRLKVVESPVFESRETAYTRERPSADSRRKNSIKGYINGALLSGNNDEPRRLERYEAPAPTPAPTTPKRERDLERKASDENKPSPKPVELVTSDTRETSSMKERSPIESGKKRGIGRGRSYSASVQDIPSMKAKAATPFDDRAKDVNRSDASKKETVTRGRSSSVAQREPQAFEADRIVDDRSIERPRRRREPSTNRDPILKDLIEHNNALKKMLETTQELLKSAERKKIELHKANNILRDEKAALLERESSARRDAATREREAQQRIMEVQARNRRQEEEIRLLKERLQYADEKNEQTTNLLQVRTADLKGAETFLTTADQYSGSDIISMVEILNAEIFQAAAFMAELLEDRTMRATEDERKKSMQKYVHGLEDAQHETGDNLFAYFLEKGGAVRKDPLPLQLAFQSLFSRWCAFMIHRFSGSGFHTDLAKLYGEIQGSEVQAVTGRWRAITFAHIKALDSQTFSDHILDMVIGLLCLCGWSLTSPRSQKAILSMQQMVKALERLWIQLKSATKEGITTADIDVFVIDFGRSYDGSRMEDSYIDALSRPGMGGSPTTDSRVLCTVGMGLQKTVTKRVDGMRQERQVDVLLKPKVALESVLKTISGEAPDSSPTLVVPGGFGGRL